MKELKAIIKAFNQIDFSKQKAVLATVVRVKGSAYRSPGSRMLILDNGQWTGSISGGCLEGDALRKARKVMKDKLPRTVTYDTTKSENNDLKINLGCNGIIDVLFEPVDPYLDNHPLVLFQKLLSIEKSVALGTIFDGMERHLGKKVLLSDNNIVHDSISQSNLTRLILSDLKDLLRSKRSHTKRYTLPEGNYDVFLELLQPVPELVIFGGGYDARPLSKLGNDLNWKVTVTDECVAHIAPYFFPEAENLSLCQREVVHSEIKIKPLSACVLISHNYEYDLEVLRQLLETDACYIGIVGPKKRFNQMIQDLGNLRVSLTAFDLQRIHAPVGLDIGSETPVEIAVAIISEIMSVFSDRNPQKLKFRERPIHLRDNTTHEMVKEAKLLDK